jgi:hypothetical protein
MAKIPNACKRKRRASSKLCCFVSAGFPEYHGEFQGNLFRGRAERDRCRAANGAKIIFAFCSWISEAIKKVVSRCARQCELLSGFPLSAIVEMLEEIWSLAWLPAAGSL